VVGAGPARRAWLAFLICERLAEETRKRRQLGPEAQGPAGRARSLGAGSRSGPGRERNLARGAGTRLERRPHVRRV